MKTFWWPRSWLHCSWNTGNLISDPVYDKICFSLTVSFIIAVIILIFSSVIAVIFIYVFFSTAVWMLECTVCVSSQFMLFVQCNLTKPQELGHESTKSKEKQAFFFKWWLSTFSPRILITVMKKIIKIIKRFCYGNHP